MTRKDLVEFGLTTNKKKKEFHGFINQALKQAPKTRGRHEKIQCGPQTSFKFKITCKFMG
jgi:hypothetical protein